MQQTRRQLKVAEMAAPILPFTALGDFRSSTRARDIVLEEPRTSENLKQKGIRKPKVEPWQETVKGNQSMSMNRRFNGASVTRLIVSVPVQVVADEHSLITGRWSYKHLAKGSSACMLMVVLAGSPHP